MPRRGGVRGGAPGASDSHSSEVLADRYAPVGTLGGEPLAHPQDEDRVGLPLVPQRGDQAWPCSLCHRQSAGGPGRSDPLGRSSQGCSSSGSRGGSRARSSVPPA